MKDSIHSKLQLNDGRFLYNYVNKSIHSHKVKNGVRFKIRSNVSTNILSNIIKILFEELSEIK